MNELKVIKIGGNVIEDSILLDSFLNDFAKLKGGKILVHGGGKDASNLAKKLGVNVNIIDGRRITDLSSLEVTTMIYAGKIICTHGNWRSIYINLIHNSRPINRSVCYELFVWRSIGIVSAIQAVHGVKFTTMISISISSLKNLIIYKL